MSTFGAGLFDAFRINGAPTYYGPNQTAFQADILEAGLIFAFVILAFSFFVVLPGIRGYERLFVFIRITVSLYIGAVILLTNFAYTWEVAEQSKVKIKYKAGSSKDIEADIGVHIGLRGINITLKGEPEVQLNETINYNEHFDWRWEQGRFGFGIFAGRFNQEFRAAQFRGLPLPILWIAEYFTFDGEGIRWGRHYRQAGWYAHIMMWLALPLWFLTVVLFFVLLKYGALMLMLTGSVMITANIIWATLRNFNELAIPLAPGKVLNFTFGGAFLVNLITGILCVLLGIVIYVMDLRFPRQIASFFGVDVLQDTDDADLDTGEMVETKTDDTEMKDMQGQSNRNGDARPPRDAAATAEEDSDDDEIYEPPTFNVSATSKGRQEHRKSRTLTLKRFQAPRRRPPPPVPTDDDDDQELYENTAYPDQVNINMGYRRR